jgi:hypothetical protein
MNRSSQSTASPANAAARRKIRTKKKWAADCAMTLVAAALLGKKGNGGGRMAAPAGNCMSVMNRLAQ